MAVKTAIFWAVLASAILPAAMASVSQALPGCDQWCGDVRIPYPFGVKEGCYHDETFFILCNKTHYNPPKAFLTGSNINVTDISISSGEVHILQFTARACYTKQGPDPSNTPNPSLTLINMTVSNTKNKFIVMGCDTYAYMSGNFSRFNSYKTGCTASCQSLSSVKNGSCLGSGCCELELPEGLKYMELDLRSFDERTNITDFNPCDYAFVIQRDKFSFSSGYISNFPEKKVPMVLDWAISNSTCFRGGDKMKCICGLNSKRIFMNDGAKYRCQCLEGFKGNPYLPKGCQDIDECTDAIHKYKCPEDSTCKNTDGTYSCECNVGYQSVKDLCIMNQKSGIDKVIAIPVGIGVGILLLIACSSWIFLAYKNWKLIKLKEQFFKQNGGLMLQQKLTSNSHGDSSTASRDTARIFTEQQLKKATKNFNESAVVGKGGYGTVFKGNLENGQVVAIKKSKVVDRTQVEQFINEVVVLSQVNHRNVVKLLGCCLETEVPLLVYEFVTNGTLHDHLHNKTHKPTLSWEIRLKIAAEAAEVLSYLHSAASIPIIHRDVKSTNILLDESFAAKVSDFGASRLVPLDQDQLTTMVQGTLGYLDPEYFLTGQLTEKSDVYSFGIVLLELLTGMEAVSFERREEERNLAMYFLAAMKEDRLLQVIEDCVVNSAKMEHIKQVAELAKRCLRLKGEERPSMKEIANELQVLRLAAGEHPWMSNNESRFEESEYLLGGAMSVETYDSYSGSVAYDSLKNHVILPTHGGR